jgi:hypothetical protein
MRIVNLCPHEIDLRMPDGGAVKIPPATDPARADVDRDRPRLVECEVDGWGAHATVPVTEARMGEVRNLPESRPDTWLVVSYPVAYANPERSDLLVPEDLIRDARGVVVACRSLARVRRPAGATVA